MCKISKSLIISKRNFIYFLLNQPKLVDKLIFLSIFFEYQKLFGSFQNLLKTRKLYLKLIEKQKPQETNIHQIISAKIELGNFNQINENYFKFLNDEYSNKNKLLINFFKNKDNNNTNLLDNKFFNFINNKSIAIVGPAKSQFDNGSEIDSFDNNVRINILISGKGSVEIDKKKMDCLLLLKKKKKKNTPQRRLLGTIYNISSKSFFE